MGGYDEWFLECPKHDWRWGRTVCIPVWHKVVDETDNQRTSRWACHACISRYRLVGHALRSWDSGSRALPHVTGDYSQWNLQRCVGEHLFPSIVLYTEKESFIRDNTINWLNNHTQAEETPHATVERGRQRRLSVSGWGGIVRNYS